MKKLLFSVMLILALLVVAPVSIAAAPAKTADVQLFVVAIDRQIVVDPNTGEVNGAVFYAGEVTSVKLGDKSKDWDRLVGDKIMVVEEVHYFVDQLGNVIVGSGIGTVKLIDKNDPANYMVIQFQAEIGGNIFTGPAWDVGTWEVASTQGGGFPRLKDGEGLWNAVVQKVFYDFDGPGPMPPVETFAGTVSITGTY